MSLKLPSVAPVQPQKKGQSQPAQVSLADSVGSANNPIVQAAQSVQQASQIASDSFPGSDLVNGVFEGIWNRIKPWLENFGGLAIAVVTILLALIIRNPAVVLAAV